ncbi:gluconeogenesis factor YvcK family protein [Demequina aurantiaca]|uniref:gluconeogenesis factor YvcK family protein n=1 Tax=Demequina aurantiaca TaxID=676200 RepID=UPI003D339921
MTTDRSIVALGGGHGLYATLTALRDLSPSLTAIVTVADDGGSSGRLRSELGILPPGDLRMALSALCEDTEWGRTWRDVLQSRFDSEGPLDGHALGNLLIASLWEHTGSAVDGLDWVARLLRARGRVLPQADVPLEIVATVESADGVVEVRGQAEVATTPGRIRSFRIEPEQPSVPHATVEAITEADMVVLGPGSWYTSVLTHFLVPDVAAALHGAARRTVVTLNLAHEDIETAGTDRVDDVRAMRDLVPHFRPAVVIADAGYRDDQALSAELVDWGVKLVTADLALEEHTARHDPAALREVYENLLAELS